MRGFLLWPLKLPSHDKADINVAGRHERSQGSQEFLRYYIRQRLKI